MPWAETLGWVVVALGGAEAKPEAFAVRFAWALGYFAEVTHYVPLGVGRQSVPRHAPVERLENRQHAPVQLGYEGSARRTDNFIGFAYQGQRTAEIARGISVEDAVWFYRHAGRLTEPALRGGLTACGATDEEAARFARALTDRIQQIGRAAGCTTEDSTGPAGLTGYDSQQASERDPTAATTERPSFRLERGTSRRTIRAG